MAQDLFDVRASTKGDQNATKDENSKCFCTLSIYKTIGQCCLMYKNVTTYYIKNFVIMVLCLKILKTNSILDTNSWHGSLEFAFEF